ncbi:hypothetical protein [uncultured Flavobacterium sp.]|uniref:SPW repeat domain-containing protein n=1 Tax=uncultured Flavobacterium sp. TaxID=165435 RepID=UPI0025D0BDA4|nr:hypothetical protein [uncultured Flavobacterium sp.]
MKKTKTKSLNVKWHSYADYALALLLIASPWIFSLETTAMESKIMVTIGMAILCLNLITHHKFGLAKMINIKLHFKIDLFFGWFLIVSPLLYGFFAQILLPHLLFGTIIIGNALLLKLPLKKLRKIRFIENRNATS